MKKLFFSSSVTLLIHGHTHIFLLSVLFRSLLVEKNFFKANPCSHIHDPYHNCDIKDTTTSHYCYTLLIQLHISVL